MSDTRVLITLCILFLIVTVGTSHADVFVNRLWDDQSSTFKVKPLELGAGGITFDRDYQNAYGELYGFDPGPPFIIEAAIIGTGAVDENGEVASFSSVSFRAGGGLLQKPFDIIFQPADNQEGRMSINGPVNFEGSSFDPIKVTGAFLILAGHPGGTNPQNSGQHSMIWSNTEFASPYIHQNTWNYNPIQFHGGHVTIQNCYFHGFDGFSDMLSFHPNTLNSAAPLWDLTIDNCRVENDSVSYMPMTFSNLRRVEFKNNYFKNNRFSEFSGRGIVSFDECGIGAIVNNTAGTNDDNLISWGNSWVSDSATIRTDPTMPLVTDAILIPSDSALAVKDGSLLKFFHSGGFAVEGRLWVDGATLTSFNDDAYGGDSDLDGVQDYIYHWSPDTPGHTGGISVDTSGYANIKNTIIRYPEGAVFAEAPIDVYNTKIRHSDGFGIWLKSFGNEYWEVRKVSIAHNEASGYGSGYSIMFDNAQGGSQRLWLDSVDIIDGDRDGAVIRANSGSPNDVRITNCRFVSNAGNGLTVELWPSLDSIEISNCSFIGNGDNGLYTSDLYGDSAVIILENSLFVGNGSIGSNRMGANIRAGIPLVLNNTFAYNDEVGLNFYEAARDQVRSINNLFYRNGNYGYVLTDPGTSVLTHNAFYGNKDGIQEVYYRLPSGLVKTIEEIQAEGGEFATNLHVDPQMSAEQIGTITSLRFDTSGFYTVVAGQPSQFAGKSLRGTAISPDTTQPYWFFVTMNTSDSLYVVGDLTAVAAPGATFRVFDHHLLDISPLVEVGDVTAVRGSHDIDGDARIIDAEPDGTPTVDIGADEYDPDGAYAAPIKVTAPIAGAVFMVEDSCTINWQASGIDSVRILFTSVPDAVPVFWDTVSACTTAAAGTIKYFLPYQPVSECEVRIEDVADAATYDASSRFFVKPYVLTSKDTQGKPIEYFVSDHAWPFGNFPDKMWPAAWYNQINYETGIDTITGITYPPYFANELFYNAKPEQFPDWQLWVHAFGVDQCYFKLPTGLVYLPSALAKWADLKGEWQGSCFGFGISSAMGFFDSSAFRGAYPRVDPYNLLHDLPLDDDHRLVVNHLLLHQFGRPHRQYKNTHIEDTPRDLLAQLKELLGLNFIDGRVIGIGNRLRGGHAVNPYRLEYVLGSPGQYRLYIYDSNHPDTGIAFAEKYIVLDSTANTWSYDDMPGWNDANGYCFLMDSAATYLTLPTIESSRRNEPWPTTAFESGTIEVYTPGATEVAIIDGNNDTTGLHAGTAINQIKGAEPIIPMTGYPAPPIGYTLPESTYSLWIGSADDSSMALSVWRDSTLYRYSRIGVDPSQLDLLAIDSGLTVTNTDSTLKPCQLMYLQTKSDQQRQYVFTDLTMDGSQGYRVYASDDSTLSLYNNGADNTCTIQLWLVGGGAGIIVTASDATIPMSGHATVIPDWSDPLLQNVRLARDMDGNGVTEDTILLNVVTSVGDNGDNGTLPKQYELAQNYPNPFNPFTTIEYSLPKKSHVRIEIFNILGQKVKTLVNETKSAGEYRAVWNSNDSEDNVAATGIYLYRFQAGDFVATKKMLLLK